MNFDSSIVSALGVLLITSVSTFADDFSDFRAEVQRKIPADWVCGQIRTLEERTLFDVNSPKNRFRIALFRHELLSHKDWTLRAERMKRAIDAIIADKDVANENMREARVALMEGMALPDGQFGSTAVCVSLSEPELHYSDIEADVQEAESVVKAILSILKIYDKGEQAVAPNRVSAPTPNSPSTDRSPED
jgi:hypothetical protein